MEKYIPQVSTLRNVGVASALGVAGVGIATAATSTVVTALGYTSSGIAAGSTAASMMSFLGGGATSAGSLVAGCQSVDSVGSLTGATIGVPLCGCIVGVGLASGALGYGVYYGVQKFNNSNLIIPMPKTINFPPLFSKL